MKFIIIVLIYITVLISQTAALSANDVEKIEFCSASKREEAQCGAYTYRIVKPLLDHLRDIQNKAKNNESKNREIEQLQSKVAELQLKVADNVQKDKVIEVYKELVDAKTTHLEQLTASYQLLSSKFDLLTELNPTTAVYLETIKDKESKILELTYLIDSDKERIQKCENQLREKELTLKNKSVQLTELNRTTAVYLETIKDKESKILELTYLIDSDKERIQKCENQLQERELTLKNKSDQLAELNRTGAANSEVIIEQNSQIENFKSQIDLEGERTQICEIQLRNYTNSIKVKDEQISDLQTQNQNMASNLKQAKVNLKEYNSDSCIPFESSSGIHTIKVPGHDSFDVLCGSAATGPGWIVIQQRINGGENFYRDFNTYRAGFGSFEGDFFLGLDKIHWLTTHQRQKLYIHLERFNGEITYATYDHFSIAGEDDQYRLLKVDGFSGNTTYSRDYMMLHKGRMFSTFDKNNIFCAKQDHGGWWYDSCGHSNLNGKYFDHEEKGLTTNFWYPYYSLKKVQMLIRPVIV